MVLPAAGTTAITNPGSAERWLWARNDPAADRRALEVSKAFASLPTAQAKLGRLMENDACNKLFDSSKMDGMSPSRLLNAVISGETIRGKESGLTLAGPGTMGIPAWRRSNRVPRRFGSPVSTGIRTSSTGTGMATWR